MKPTQLLAIMVVLLLALGAMTGIFVIKEGEQAVIVQFGKIVREVDQSGLHFKIPFFIQSVHRLEKRVLPWNSAAESMQTADKKRIFIDVWARWRIVSPQTFYERVGTEQRGQKILDDLLDSAIRDVVARNKLIDVVRSTNNPLYYEDQQIERADPEKVTSGRSEMEKQILAAAAVDLSDEYGMELTDVHIKRVNYYQSVKETVYERMRSERQRIAQLFESEAEEEKNRILGRTRKELDEIEGDMKRQSAEIRGEADAQVTRITAEAYNQSKETREFYEFLRRLDVLRSTLGSGSRVILSTNSELFELLNSVEQP